MTDMPVGERRPLAPPVSETGTLGWVRKHLFSSWANGITTIVLIVVIGWVLSWFLEWAVFTANISATTGAECRGGGACWALIREKFRYIFFGSFPFEQHWRPLFAVITMLTMLILTSDRRMWNAKRLAVIWGIGTPRELNAYRALAAIGAVGVVLRFVGVLPSWSLPIAPLSYVETGLWGGLPVTIILATYGLLFAFPYGILLALGRRSNLPLIKGLCVGFIELIRGVPLISLLIMA